MKSRLLVITFLFCCLFFSNRSSFAQNPKDTLISYYMKIGKEKVAEKKFSEANDYFKKIFALKTTVPDEFAYFYGYTLLNLKKYTQGRNALYKYLDLQGDKGIYSQKAYEALEQADCQETGYKDVFVECDICYGDSTLEINCRHCKGKGIEICPLCKGSGVATTSTNFGSSYHTCHRCAGEKIVKCTVCKGHLKEKIICYNCNGKGRKKIRKKC
jgi:hypothetical protein